MKRVIKDQLKRVIKPDGKIGKKVYSTYGKILIKHVHGSSYKAWMAQEKGLFIEKVEQENVLISILVPCFNTPDKYARPLIQSMLQQTYGNWQLCIADASSDKEIALKLKKLCEQDKRITYIRVDKNQGISGNTNAALAHAKGDFVGLLDHDDVLSVHALNEVAGVIQAKPKVDFIYSDEDKLSDNGKARRTPFFKPDWSPDLLLGVNYITHFAVIRRSLLEHLGGLRSDYDGAQDYDLFMRVTEKAKEIHHIPKILYHWRLADGSTAKVVGEKNYADDAGRKALGDMVKRRGLKAEVLEIAKRPTNYRLKYQLPKKQPKVSIIIPFKDKPELLRQCVNSILKKTTYKNYEIILVSNNSTENATHKLLEKYKKVKTCKVHHWDHHFNYSAVNNYGATKASGEYIVLLNNDTEVITKDWLDELVSVAMQPGVGAVGPLLMYPKKKDGIQHAGVVLGLGGMAGHVFRNRQPDEWTDFGLTTWPRDYLAVTAACLVVEKKKFKEAGGLDETFIVAGNDVAFCLTLTKLGYRNIYWPFARLYHYESASVKTYTGIQSDYDHSLTYYRPYLDQGDGYFNPNLSLKIEGVRLRGK